MPPKAYGLQKYRKVANRIAFLGTFISATAVADTSVVASAIKSTSRANMSTSNARRAVALDISGEPPLMALGGRPERCQVPSEFAKRTLTVAERSTEALQSAGRMTSRKLRGNAFDTTEAHVAWTSVQYRDGNLDLLCKHLQWC